MWCMLGCHSSNNLCLEPNDADCQSPCAAEVAQQVKVLAAQPDELSRALRTHRVEKQLIPAN